MKKTSFLLCLFAFAASAADVWMTKPFTEWSDKDVQKILNDSPWSRPFVVLIDNEMAPSSSGKGKMSGGADTPEADETMRFIARWESALPLKQAEMRQKYGAEAATAAEAKAYLDHTEDAYVIRLTGPLNRYIGGNPDVLKAGFMATSTVTVKGKGTVKPSDVAVDLKAGTGEVTFRFPRSAGFTAEDKEIEFATKLGPEAMKFKFRPKDMALNGKLEL